MQTGVQNVPVEWIFHARKHYPKPFDEVQFSGVFKSPNQVSQIVPGFWAGGNEWRLRFAAPTPGVYTFETVCSHQDDPGLHAQSGQCEIQPYSGANPLLRHGPVMVAPDQRHLQHLDGTPFFWLADTWWMGLCQRFKWPGDFHTLTADRVKKGFNVIQIVAGLYPDMPAFDERGANEAGYPWENEFKQINPAYFNQADTRLAWLVNAGLMPCIVGSWGYYLKLIGASRIQAHWRYLVARYGAYPVCWCLAGEATMPYYLSTTKEYDQQELKKGWTELAQFVSKIDPFQRPITIHPTQFGRDQIENPELLDFEMLQTGHSSHLSFPNTLATLKQALERTPKMPVLVAEVCYEGILEASREEVQRQLFWSCLLNGAAGHTYGANGIWQVNTPERPFGPSPHGTSWGDRPWPEAANLPGATQLGIGKKILSQFPWDAMQPHPEWVEPPADYTDPAFRPYCAGILREWRIIYFSPFQPLARIKNLEPDCVYRAWWCNPSTGGIDPIGIATPDHDGNWQPPQMPIFRDWVLILSTGEIE